MCVIYQHLDCSITQYARVYEAIETLKYLAQGHRHVSDSGA